ncbi:MAG: hypothetical protein WCK35_10705 [Chloroflexota bacterium]
MEIKQNSDDKAKATGRKIVTVVIVLIVFIALVFAARFLVGSLDIVELLKKLHGG